MKSKIESYNDLCFFLREDIKHMGGVRSVTLFRWLLGDENARMLLYIWVLRHLEFFSNVKIPIIGTVMRIFFEVWHKRQSYKYGVYIGKNICGYGLRIVHIGGIIMNANKVGNYCTVTQGVVLGKKDDNEHRPYIGNNVKFTLGCKVIGKVTIGDNVVVCPNSVVIKDVPSDCIVSGVPISIVKPTKKQS